MKYLLDTHVLLWALENNPNLPAHIKDIILDENNVIYLSAASLLEISIKHKKHPDILKYTVEEIINYSTRAGYVFLSLSHDSVLVHSKYDFGFHNDPFDQILISQSIANNMKLITHDEAINIVSPTQTVFF